MISIHGPQFLCPVTTRSSVSIFGLHAEQILIPKIRVRNVNNRDLKSARNIVKRIAELFCDVHCLMRTKVSL